MNSTEQSLLSAIRAGELATVNRLLNSSDINKSTLQDENANPAVYLALITIKDTQDPTEKEKRLKIVKNLLKANYPINATNRNGNTPLHKAIKKNLTEIIKLLASKGADVNARNSEGRTPLYVAMGDEESDNTQLFELVLNLEGVDPYARVNASSTSHESVKDILLKRTKDTREAISKPAKDMQKLFTARVRKLNLEVERINQLPVVLSDTGKVYLERMVQENRKLFFSYSWNEDSVSTVPMVLRFQEYAKANNIIYFLDRDNQRGIAAIGQNKLERFMRTATSESNVTIAFINEHYLKSRNCLFEAYQFWDKERQAFKENFYWIMHPEEMTVYGNAFNVTPYIQHWKNRRDGLEADRKKIDDTLGLGSHIEEAKFLREIGEAIEGMVNYLAGHVYASYEDLRKSGYEEILTKAITIEPPNTLSTRQSSVKDMVRHHEEQTKKLSEDVSRIKSELEKNKKKQQDIDEQFQKAQAEIKQQQGVLKGQIEQLKQERERLQQQDTVNKTRLDEEIRKLTDELGKAKQQQSEREQKRKEERLEEKGKIQQLEDQLTVLTGQHQENTQRQETESESIKKAVEEKDLTLRGQLKQLQDDLLLLKEELKTLKQEKVVLEETLKANASDLEKKVSTADLDSKLALKANTSDLEIKLENKVESTDFFRGRFFARGVTPFDRIRRKSISVKQDYQITDEELHQTLDAVVRGRLEEVETALEENKRKNNGYCALLHVQGDTTEAEQKFYEMLPKMTGGARQGGSPLMLTPWQFALRESDIQMCELILRYFDAQNENHPAAEQMNALKEDEELIRTYGNPFFNLQPTIDAYKTLQDNWRNWSWDQKNKHWCEVIGKHQQSWPAWLRYDMTQPGKDAPWCKKTVNARPQKRDLSAPGMKPEYSWTKGYENKNGLGGRVIVNGSYFGFGWVRGPQWERSGIVVGYKRHSKGMCGHDGRCLDNEQAAVVAYRETLQTKFATLLHNTSENASHAPR